MCGRMEENTVAWKDETREKIMKMVEAKEAGS